MFATLSLKTKNRTLQPTLGPRGSHFQRLLKVDKENVNPQFFLLDFEILSGLQEKIKITGNS